MAQIEARSKYLQQANRNWKRIVKLLAGGEESDVLDQASKESSPC
jgi:hypothetical protein